MDYFITSLCVHAVDRADLQPVPGVHLGHSAAFVRPSERLGHQIYPPE